MKSTNFADMRAARIMDAVERCADDPEIEAAAKAIWFDWVTTRHPPQPPKAGRWGWLHEVIADAFFLFDDYQTEEMWDRERARARDPRAAIAQALYISFREAPLEAFTGGEGDAVYYCMSAIDRAGVLRLRELPGQSLHQIDLAKHQVQWSLANVLRDIFGNPFRTFLFSPEWRTENAVLLARQMYESRDFSVMPILADALQEADCEVKEILNHCRGDGPHVRGCRAVDLVLGKE